MLRTIQSAWPATRITWIIGATELGLMSGIDGIEFITYDKANAGVSLAHIRRTLQTREFPLLLHMHASMRANRVSRRIRAQRRIGFDRARARDFQWLFTNERIEKHPHQRTHGRLFGFTEHLGIGERALRWDIPVAESDRAFALEHCGSGAPICVISPCSSQRLRNYRNWRAENYVAVATAVQRQYGARIVLTGGPTDTERDYGEAISRGTPGPVVNLIGRTSLKQMLAVLELADLVICPDSGPAHMATAVGTPVVGLYATSNPLRTGPYLSQHLVVNRYPEAVQAEFGRPVEALRWGQRVRNPGAMELIRVEYRVALVARVLA